MISEWDWLIDVVLNYVIFEGMGDKVIIVVVQELGMFVELVWVYLLCGGVDLVVVYYCWGDVVLCEWLVISFLQGWFCDWIIDVVMYCLLLLDCEMVWVGVVIFLLLQNVVLGVWLIWESVDVIWDGFGDILDDVNWYFKCVMLLMVYGVMVLYWLGDVSLDVEDICVFFECWIEGVMCFEKIKGCVNVLFGILMLLLLVIGWIWCFVFCYGFGCVMVQFLYGVDV